MRLADVPLQLVLAWGWGDPSKTDPIPVPSQIGIKPGAASWSDGFPPLCATPVTSGGIPPAKADMNGALFEMSAIDVWYSAGAGFVYNSVFSAAVGGYPQGARVLMASGLGYWRSIVDNNTTDPDTGGTGWVSEVPTTIFKKGSGSPYVTTSITFVNVDDTNLSLTVTIPLGMKLILSASGALYGQTASPVASVSLYDTVPAAQIAGTQAYAGSVQPTGWAINTVIVGDGNSHTVSLQWLTSNGSDAIEMVNIGAFLPSIVAVLTASL